MYKSNQIKQILELERVIKSFNGIHFALEMTHYLMKKKWVHVQQISSILQSRHYYITKQNTLNKLTLNELEDNELNIKGMRIDIMIIIMRILIVRMNVKYVINLK